MTLLPTLLASVALGSQAPTCPLWPGPPPGTVPPGTEHEERAQEVPHLDLYLLPPSSAARPLVVVCPGGGYGGRAGHEGGPVAQWLNGLGLHAVVCHYRVSPWRHPAPLQDLQRALRLVRHHADAWGVDPVRVGVLGFSAGGHLAASAANLGEPGQPQAEDPVERQSGRPNLLIACYPVITFGEFRHDGSLKKLLGPTPDPALRQQLSLETSVTAANPPTFLWHTADDEPVPVQNSLLYAAALRQHRVPFSLHVYPSGRHGLGLAKDHPGCRAWTEACAAWLTGLGWRETGSK